VRPAATARRGGLSGPRPLAACVLHPAPWDRGQRRLSVRRPAARRCGCACGGFAPLVLIVVVVVFTIVAAGQVGLSLAILAGVIDTRVPVARPLTSRPGGSASPRRRRPMGKLARMRLAVLIVALNAGPSPTAGVIDHCDRPTGRCTRSTSALATSGPIRTFNGNSCARPGEQELRLEHAKWEAQQAGERLSTAVGFDVPVHAC